MSKYLLSFLLIVWFGLPGHGQKVSGKLQFERGKSLAVHMDLKATVTQQAMGNAISFSTDGFARYNYNVIDIKHDQITLRHEPKRIKFQFDGMGHKKSFDSDKKADMDGQFGEPVKNILGKKFDMVIDENGSVIMTFPEKIEPVKTDERLRIVLNMIKDISDVVYPPQRGEASFFKILPGRDISLGENWADSLQLETGTVRTTYTLAGITDSTLIVDFKSTAATVAKALLASGETITTLNSTGTGKIILNRNTGIIKGKTTTTESNGTMEAMGGSTPVTSKTVITIHVKSQ